MGDFVNLIRSKLGLEPKRDVTVTGKTPNEVIIHRPMKESAGSSPVVFAPVRMNPPTPAHRLIVDTAKQAAADYDAPHHIILTRSHDVVKKKRGSAIRNPLTPEQKLKHVRRFFPDANVQLAHPSRPNLLSQLSDLHSNGHDHLVMVAGGDRIPEYKRLIDAYNGKSGPHGYFNFKKVEYRNAGQRDPEATGMAGWSATKSRQTAEGGNFDTFKKNAVPSHVSHEHAQELYHDLRGGMGLNDVSEASEGYPVAAIPTPLVRDVRGKKSPLNNLPAPPDKGNIGLDSDLKDKDDGVQLWRRRVKKRLTQVGYLESFDQIGGDLSQGPTAYPVTTVSVPTAVKIKKSKPVREGLFSDTNVSSENGSPNYGSDVTTGSEQTSLNVTKKSKKIKEENDKHDIRGDEDDDADYRGPLLKRGTRVRVKKDGYQGLGNIDNYDPVNGNYVVSIDNGGSNMLVQKDDVEPIKESKNTPFVRPHFGDAKNPTKQTGWKASNRHGRVKYFGLEFRASAVRHANGTPLKEQVMTIMGRRK